MSKQPRPLVERAGWAVFWNIAFFPLKVVIPLLAGVVVVRLLRAEGFALYVTALALLDFLGLFSDFGIERALPRFLPEVELRRGRPGVIQMLGNIALAKGGVLLIIVLALAVAPQYWIEQFKLGENGGLILVIIGSLLVLGALSDVTIQVLYTHFRQRATNTLDIMVAIVRPSLTAGFVLLGMGVMGALLALLAATLLAVVISLYLAVQLVRSMPEGPDARAAEVRVPSNRPMVKRFTSYAALNYVINWSVYLYDLDFVLIAMTLLIVSPEQYVVESAAIALAYKFAKEILRALVVPLTGVQTPLFARLYAEGRIDGLRTAYATLTKVLVLGLLPAAVGLVLTGRNFLQVLYGQKGGDAVLNPETETTIIACTAILAIGLFGEAMISVALNVLMVYEEYRAVLAARVMSLVSIPLLWALVPAYGAVGGAIAVSIAALLSRSVALGFGLTRLRLPFPSRFFVRVGTASIAMGVALLPFLAFLPADILSTAAMVLTGAVVFFAVFKLLGGMDQADKERFLSLRLPFVKQALRFL
ncbi:MAG TPA: oligosaccharide flippase family protein [Chloroflexia bacterium]|nr:oligosaccharide flippase family protein [Chloroflexia bacterium]